MTGPPASPSPALRDLIRRQETKWLPVTVYRFCTFGPTPRLYSVRWAITWRHRNGVTAGFETDYLRTALRVFRIGWGATRR